jgi:hypothetical protein
LRLRNNSSCAWSAVYTYSTAPSCNTCGSFAGTTCCPPSISSIQCLTVPPGTGDKGTNKAAYLTVNCNGTNCACAFRVDIQARNAGTSTWETVANGSFLSVGSLGLAVRIDPFFDSPPTDYLGNVEFRIRSYCTNNPSTPTVWSPVFTWNFCKAWKNITTTFQSGIPPGEYKCGSSFPPGNDPSKFLLEKWCFEITTGSVAGGCPNTCV